MVGTLAVALQRRLQEPALLSANLRLPGRATDVVDLKGRKKGEEKKEER